MLFAYEQALSNTGAWPLESAFMKNSVDEILHMLHNFPGPKTARPKTCARGFCAFDFAEVVATARREVLDYFDGLCLGTSSVVLSEYSRLHCS